VVIGLMMALDRQNSHSPPHDQSAHCLS